MLISVTNAGTFLKIGTDHNGTSEWDSLIARWAIVRRWLNTSTPASTPPPIFSLYFISFQFQFNCCPAAKCFMHTHAVPPLCKSLTLPASLGRSAKAKDTVIVARNAGLPFSFATLPDYDGYALLETESNRFYLADSQSQRPRLTSTSVSPIRSMSRSLHAANPRCRTNDCDPNAATCLSTGTMAPFFFGTLLPLPTTSLLFLCTFFRSHHSWYSDVAAAAPRYFCSAHRPKKDPNEIREPTTKAQRNPNRGEKNVKSNVQIRHYPTPLGIHN